MKIKNGIWLILSLWAMAACMDSDDDDSVALLAAEMEILDTYIAENNITTQPTESGLYFIEETYGSGGMPQAGDTVSIHYTGTFLNGEVFDSSIGHSEPFEFSLGSGDVIQGWDEGIALMHKGGKCTLIVPSSLAYGDFGLNNFIEPYTTLIYNIELIAINHKERLAEERKRLQSYLEENNITTEPTPSGLYFIEVSIGTGQTPISGDHLTVHYTGSFLDGEIFDSSYEREMPFEFTLGVGDVILGWDEGVAMMHNEGEAILLIPSPLGYGDSSIGPIPPYTTLVFNIELLSIN